MNAPHEMRFQLHISSEEFANYYRGHARAVVVLADNGQTLSLPASAFQPFVSHQGIAGRFVVQFDQQFKLVNLRRADVADR